MNELASRGYDEEWLAAQDPPLRRTVLNLFAKMSSLDLWRFVAREDGSDVGKLHFRCTDVAGLRRWLAEHPDFTTPVTADERWESTERRATASLHLKHFAGWPDDKVQAHIDRAGLWLPGWRRWIVPWQVWQWARHWVHYESYRDVETIARLLEEQGLTARAGTSPR